MTNRTDLYNLLTKIIPAETLRTENYLRLSSPGFMDLVAEVLSRRGDVLRVSLAHYFQQNGDLVADPDCEIEINLASRNIRPLVIQMAFGPYVRAVDHDQDGMEVVHSRRSREIREFLVLWLRNLHDQEFAYRPGPTLEPEGDHHDAISS